MISIDTIRSAVLSDQPWARLDEIVRAELVAGRTTRKIFDELWSISNEVQDTPGLSENGEDALGDTLDALNGFCSSKDAYKNPPILPSEDEIAELPRWARVAFAARCARHGEFAYMARFPDEGGRASTVVNELIREVERTALFGARPSSLKTRNDFTDTELRVFIRDLVMPAFEASWQSYDSVSSVIATAVAATASANAIASIAESSLGNKAIRRDFDHLLKLAEWQKWTDDTPVPPEVFGPLWPEGPPKGWPADPDVPQRADLPLELLSRAKVLEQMTEDETVNLFNQINAYYIARTGIRLTMEDLRPMVAAGVLAEV